MIPFLQLSSGAAWLIVMILTARSAVAVFRTNQCSRDSDHSVFFFMGALQVGFSIRWALFPDTINAMHGGELNFWAALYSLSVGLALWVLVVALVKGRGSRD